MIDLAVLGTIAFIGLAISAPVLFVRFVSRGEPLDVMRLFTGLAELPWPRGVQEEEPQPWRWNARPWRPTHDASRSLGDPVDVAGDALPDAV